MAIAAKDQRPDVETLAAVIARSQIVVARILARHSQPRHCLAHLPEGFDAADLAVLDWIAAEGRRAGRKFLPI
jgi:hypothetical protein